MLSLVHRSQGMEKTRDWVVDRVTELEGLKDDLLIDMVMRRVEDAGSKEQFEESISVLMGERARSFTTAMCAFLIDGKNLPMTSTTASESAADSKTTFPARSKAAGKQPMCCA